MNTVRGDQSGYTQDLVDMVLLLLDYFDENQDFFLFDLLQCFFFVIVIFIGSPCYSAKRYMLIVDRTIMEDNMSFYCFNVHYPSELATTLEFL